MRTDRNRLIDLRDGLDLRDRGGPGQTQRMLVRVYNGGSLPASVQKVYLCHPVLTDAADTEGAIPGFTTDTSTTIPVIVIGPRIPVVNDLLVAHSLGGRWIAGDDKDISSTIPPVLCSPCDIPGANLTFSWTNSIAGPGSISLTYNSTTHVYSGSFLFSNGTTTCNVTFKCLLGFFNLGVSVGLDGTCVNNATGFKILSSTCTPFHISWGYNTTLNIACDDLRSAGYIFFIDGP